MEKKGKIRLLCLHGFNTNKEVLNYQLRFLKAKYADKLEFVPVDGPLQKDAQADETLLTRGFKPPFFEWYNIDSKNYTIPDMGDTLNYLVSVLNREGPFHGFFAFSGANGVVTAF